MRLIPREIESLWTLFTAPTIWAAHFLAAYVGAAVYCAKQQYLPFGFGGVRAFIAIITILALAGILLAGYLAWRQWGFGAEDPPHSGWSREERNRFQGFATLLLCALSFVAVVFTAMPAFFIAECNP